MKCGDVGALRAYLDAERPAGELQAMRSHLADCRHCRDELEELQRTGASVAGWLAPETGEPAPASLALARLRFHLADAGEQRPSVSGDLRRWLPSGRVGWVAACAAAVGLVALLTVAPVRLAAEDFLGIFRVQRFAAVTIDPSQLPRLAGPAKVGEHPAVTPPQLREATLSDATQAVDFPVRQPQYLPPALAGQSRLLVSSPAEFSFTVNLAAVKEYLAQAGALDIRLLASLDGATLRARVPASVVAVYGAATLTSMQEGTQPPAGPYLLLAQSRGPTLQVPDTVDVDLLREQVLALPVLPPDLAAQLRAIKDWRNTLIIPVRPGTHRDVTVAGAPALLINHSDKDNTLLWQGSGIVYALSGSVAESELMRIANSLR